MPRDVETPVSILRTTSLVAVLLGWLVNLPAFAADDKAIIVDEGLAASADVLPVTVAAAKTFKVADFRFGEYVVVSSKLGMAKGHTSGWLSPFEHDENEHKFTFVMKGAAPETARVAAVQRFESGPLKRHEVLPGGIRSASTRYRAQRTTWSPASSSTVRRLPPGSCNSTFSATWPARRSRRGRRC